MLIAQKVIQNEMNDFQSRLQRCSMSCQDGLKDKFGPLENNSSKIPAAERHLMSCMSSCVDKHITLLRSIQSKIESDIDRVSK